MVMLEMSICLFGHTRDTFVIYLHATSKNEIHIYSSKHETGFVFVT